MKEEYGKTILKIYLMFGVVSLSVCTKIIQLMHYVCYTDMNQHIGKIPAFIFYR